MVLFTRDVYVPLTDTAAALCVYVGCAPSIMHPLTVTFDPEIDTTVVVLEPAVIATPGEHCSVTPLVVIEIGVLTVTELATKIVPMPEELLAIAWWASAIPPVALWIVHPAECACAAVNRTDPPDAPLVHDPPVIKTDSGVPTPEIYR